MFFSQPNNLVALFPSLTFFFLSVETETESSSASITNIKVPDSTLTERRPAPLCPAPLNHRRINITIGGWRAFRLKWWHIVRARSRPDPRDRCTGRSPPPLRHGPLRLPGGCGSPSPQSVVLCRRQGALQAGVLQGGRGGVVAGREPQRLLQSEMGGRFIYANQMQMKALKLLIWEYKYPDLWMRF